MKKGLYKRRRIMPADTDLPPPAPSGYEDDAIASFDEWKESGWYVMKGQKAHSFDITGLAQFTRHQVKRK
jgi:hypothetical protein